MQSLAETAAALQVAKLCQCLGSNSELVPVTRSVHAPGQRFQSLPAKYAAGLLYVCHFGFRASFYSSIGKREPRCPTDVAARKPEALCDLVEMDRIIDLQRLAPVQAAGNNIRHVQRQGEGALHRRAAYAATFIEHQTYGAGEAFEFRQHCGFSRR